MNNSPTQFDLYPVGCYVYFCDENTTYICRVVEHEQGPQLRLTVIDPIDDATVTIWAAPCDRLTLIDTNRWRFTLIPRIDTPGGAM